MLSLSKILLFFLLYWQKEMQFCYFNIKNLYFIYLSVSCDIKSALLLCQRYITGAKLSVTLGAKNQALTGMCTLVIRNGQNISDFTMNQP